MMAKKRDDPIDPYKWKPGQTGNPKGRPKIPEDIRALMREKSNEYRKRFLYWIDAPIDDIVKCKGTTWEVTGLDRMITSAIVQAMNGDTKAMDAVLDRILGKAPQQLDIDHTSSTLQSLVERFSKLSDQELIDKATEARKLIKERNTIDVTKK